MNKISIITATYNASEHLPTLIKSLQEQTDKDFEWVIADGLSTDDTLALLEGVTDINVTITSEKDFGIYDALNRGILKSNSEFYLVLGADDYLYPYAIERFKKEINNEIDIIAANINNGGKIIKPNSGSSWLRMQFSYVAGHAVSTLFRKNLHDRFGLYSNRFPIAADQYFISLACKNGAKIKAVDFTSGYFNNKGLSSTDIMGALTESFRVQLLVEKNNSLQFLLFFIRVLKSYIKF